MGLKTRSLILFILVLLHLQAFSKPTKRYRYDADFLDSEIQRIRSGKAGQEMDPIWTPNKSDIENISKSSAEPEKEGSSDETSTSDEDYYGSSEEIDVTCAPDKGWHIRGQRCVPIKCPGGPSERDFNTGECLYAPSSRGRFNKPFQQWNDLNHVYRSSPMSSNLVRSMILMRKG